MGLLDRFKRQKQEQKNEQRTNITYYTKGKKAYNYVDLYADEEPAFFSNRTPVYNARVIYLNDLKGTIREKALKIQLGLDVAKLQTDEEYKKAVMMELLDRDRIMGYLNPDSEVHNRKFPKRGNYVGEIIEKNGKYRKAFNTEAGQISHDLLMAREKNMSKVNEARNVQLFQDNLNKIQLGIESGVITGLTHNVEGDISLGNDLFAVTKIGRIRKNQEDAVALLKSKDLKMMIVSDGMGGHESGEVASNIVIEKLKEWFENLSEAERDACSNNPMISKDVLERKINDISKEVIQETNGKGGATLVCALIGKNNTMIANVGDSRAYVIKNGKLEQVSEDDAYVQALFDLKLIPTKEAMRFHRKSNMITSNIGNVDESGNFVKLNPHIRNLNNNQYDMLLLFSDGVTDCLSEEEIAVICRTTNRKEAAKKIAEAALSRNSKAPAEVMNNLNYEKIIIGGKDNTTVAAFTPKKKMHDER